METIAAAGAGFLAAVLWFDLMFDVQARGRAGDVLPADILASISSYYRRVTTEARPMNRLVSVVMILTVFAIAGEIGWGARLWWIGWLSLALALAAMGLAAIRVVPTAVRLGGATDTPQEQTRLARSIYADHLYCFSAIVAVLVLQLVERF